MLHDISGAIAAASFWMFVAIVVVAGVGGSVLRHRETQKTIRQAIERGQTLDPATLERLMQSGHPRGPPPRGLLLFGGIMLLAVGAGLAMIGWFTSQTNPSQLYPGLGAGSLVGLLGVGLLVAARVIGGPRGDGPG